MPLPTERAASGSFCGPSTISAMTSDHHELERTGCREEAHTPRCSGYCVTKATGTGVAQRAWRSADQVLRPRCAMIEPSGCAAGRALPIEAGGLGVGGDGLHLAGSSGVAPERVAAAAALRSAPAGDARRGARAAGACRRSACSRRAHVLALLVAQQLAERPAVDRVAAAARPRRRDSSRCSTREQVLERSTSERSRHQAPPCTNGPRRSRGSASQARASRRELVALVGADRATPAPQLDARQLRERLEVGAHLALLQVLGEARARPRALRRGKLRAYSSALAAGRRLAAEVRGSAPRAARVPRSCARMARSVARARRRSAARRRPVRRDRRALQPSSDRAAAAPEPGSGPADGGGSPPPQRRRARAACRRRRRAPRARVRRRGAMRTAD